MSYSDFYQSLKTDERARYLIQDNHKKFMALEEAGKFHMKKNLQTFTLEETLGGYIEDKGLDLLTGEECLKKVVAANHGPLLLAVVEVFFERIDKKKRWVHAYGD